MRAKKRELACYGNVRLLRQFCRACDQYALVVGGVLQCCDKPASSEFDRVVRVVEPAEQRRQPTAEEKREILERQDHRCLYCEQPFGSVRLRGDRPVRLRLEWDHDIPFSYSRDNSAANFVAACHVCNNIKASRIFQTLEEARIAITHEREKSRRR